MRKDYHISEVVPYINWIYFFHAWGTAAGPQEEKDRLRREAEQRLEGMEGCYMTHALVELKKVHSEGDDIVFETGERLPMLRQQQVDSDFCSLADFVDDENDRMGVFATSVDIGMETDFKEDPYEKMMMQLLADRLAEATAERLHEWVRKEYWGYAPDEQLSIGEMQQEHFQGIRPAVGYPSMPDTSLNFEIDRIVGFSKIGIRLTQSGAMKPHASVSGLMMANPHAHYFAVGKIGEDQLEDYACRRGVPLELMRMFLGGVL